MYTIGEFSSISSISKKTLRYYDEIGLLKPAKISEENGYRLYTKDQINTSMKILVYKGFGLSLIDIKNIIISKNNKELNKLLSIRMDNIDKEIDLLMKQKQSIKAFKNNKNNVSNSAVVFQVERKVFEKGVILSIERHFDAVDIHQLITDFYDLVASQNLVTTSGHYIRRSIESNYKEDAIQIYAYVQHEKNENAIEIEKLDTIRISCDDISNKNQACAYLLDYAKSNNLTLDGVIEEYTITNGKLGAMIYGVLI